MTDRPATRATPSEPRLSLLEATLRNDFASERRQTSADRDLDQLAVDRAMFLARQPQSATPQTTRAWTTAARRRPLVALAIAALFGGGVAAAMFGVRPATPARAPLAMTPPSKPLSPPRAQLDRRAPAKASPNGHEPAAQSEPPRASSPGAVRSPAPLTDTPKTAGDVHAQSGAATLFERANGLRRQGQTRAALGEYEKLQARYPAAREARLSHAICGRLHLQLSQPTQALQQFNSYLVGGGPAAQDALAGRADAYRQLGDSVRERAAWQRLLGNYPKSVHAERARSRLKVLE